MKSRINFKSNKKILVFVILFLVFIFFNIKLKSLNKNSNLIDEGLVNLEYISSNKRELENKNVLPDSTLTIPAISLYNIEVKDGIDENTLNEYIGHFPSTNSINGNVGLAAHNRGYKNNYFMNINRLKENDEIIYKFKDEYKKYKVFKKVQIDSYDWSYLNNTNENILTLITCIEDKPDKRLVVQAIE